MRNRLVALSAVAILLPLMVILTGCPKPQGTGTTPADTTQNVQDNQQEQSNGDETPVSTENPENSFPFGQPTNREQVTEENLGDITMFGNFQYPGSTLITDDSYLQRLPEGTEIYRLEFGASVAVETVLQWYRDNLEGDAKETSGRLGDGTVIAGFEYYSPDETWFKTITIKGYPSGTAVNITVNIRATGEIPADDSDGQAGSPE